MKITVDVSGNSLNPVEEMFIFSTVGSVARNYDGRLKEIAVEISPVITSEGKRFRCEIEIATDSGGISTLAHAESRGNAVVCAAEKVDRMLFKLIHAEPEREERSTESDRSSESIAA